MSSYESTTYRGEFSGSSNWIRNQDQYFQAVDRGSEFLLTFCKLFDGDVVQELDLLEDELSFVDLDDERRVALASSETEFAQGVLDRLRDINGQRLC